MTASRATILPAQRVDWCTPLNVCAAVYVFFRAAPDLDPCGAPGQLLLARKVVMLPEDGLAIPWRGTVYCNPPYGRGIAKWIEKASLSPEAETLMLIPAATSAAYFQELVFKRASAICFWRGRIQFVGAKTGCAYSHCIPYYGPNPVHFQEIFAPNGMVYLTGRENALKFE